MSANTANKICITGMGVISALGSTTEENLHSLLEGRSGIEPITLLQDLRKPFLAGEVKLSNEDLKAQCGIPDIGTIHRTTLLALKAAREAWGTRSTDTNIRTALFYGTTIGGINMNDQDIRGKSLEEQQTEYNRLHDGTFAADLIARELGIHGYRATLSTACSTAANAILMGARMIRAGLIDRALVGGSEALTNYTLNGFDSLQLYDTERNRPFDRDRKGLNLGEGGAFLVLESESSQQRSGNPIIGHLLGWGNACDGYHQTASSPEGIGSELAFYEALKTAGISSEKIDYVNVHGTGTPNNDLTESTVLQKVFKHVPPFSSTKSYTGHTLAAAGGIEAVFSLLSLQTGTLFPNLQFENPIPECGLIPVRQVTKAPDLQIILSSSFGFGGNCTQLIFGK